MKRYQSIKQSHFNQKVSCNDVAQHDVIVVQRDVIDDMLQVPRRNNSTRRNTIVRRNNNIRRKSNKRGMNHQVFSYSYQCSLWTPHINPCNHEQSWL